MAARALGLEQRRGVAEALASKLARDGLRVALGEGLEAKCIPVNGGVVPREAEELGLLLRVGGRPCLVLDRYTLEMARRCERLCPPEEAQHQP